MESIFSQSSTDHQSLFPYNKQMKNPRKNTRSFNSKPGENMHRGLLLAPPLLSYSYPPSHSLHNYQHQQPPPLLPLPIPNNSRNLSCPPTNKKSNRTRDQSLTPKKSKQPTTKRPQQEPKTDFLKPAKEPIAESLIFTSVDPLGPDPSDLPKNVSKVLCAGIDAVSGFEFEKFSGSGFTISPPPSSLPLPKFSLRPKLISCNAEAAGIDAGATDNLRRLLRLR
ncbi:hypothetical protein Patl1_09517 [Pistacia atlantica]|uniref:Uncharacterized protein n=1 Tax=Pistacia atlantica TaxID=434234 RepID=A0ACC1AHP5_9ROSI|nr:hypothetical protein Patl1_09517 [Pistacia atlantica]